MALVPNIENITIVTKNVIPSLSETPYQNFASILAGGSPAVYITEYKVSGKTITWIADYDLEVGEVVTVSYTYDDGLPASVGVYDPTDPTQNPVTVNYNLTVTTINNVPNLVHTPVATTLVVKVNGVRKTEGVDWSYIGRVITWISGSTLNVGDIVNVSYRVS
jgi:hypothetical protein